MHEFTSIPDAIKESQDKKLSKLSISLPESMSKTERNEQITLLSNFIADNSSITELDFSNTYPINGGIPTLSEKEAEILAGGLEKNLSIRSVVFKNDEAYKKAVVEEEPVWGPRDIEPWGTQHRIIDKEAYGKYQKINEKTSPYIHRNNKLHDQYKDAISDISKNILGARLANAVLKDETINQVEKVRYLNNKTIEEQLFNKTKEVLFSGMEIKTIKAVSDSWHLPASQTKILKERDYGGVSWLPIFGKKEIEIPKDVIGKEGWKLVSLTEPHALKKEGEKLNNCVGGYTDKCNRNNSHIVSIRNPKGKPVSLIEIETNYSDQSFKIIQHVGDRNNQPPKESEAIEKQILKKLAIDGKKNETPLSKLKTFVKKRFKKNALEEHKHNWDSLNIDYAKLEQGRVARVENVDSPRTVAKDSFGFDLLDEKKLKKVRDVFKDIIAPTGQSVKNAAGEEINNFSPEVRKELRKRFQELKTIEIDILPEKIGCKSKFCSPEVEKKHPKETKKEKSFSEDILLKSTQSSINNIFSEYDADSIKVSIDKSNDSKFGEVKLTMPESFEVDKVKEKLEKIFKDVKKTKIEKSKDEGGSCLQICGNTPKLVSQILDGYSKKNSKGAAIQI